MKKLEEQVARAEAKLASVREAARSFGQAFAQPALA